MECKFNNQTEKNIYYYSRDHFLDSFTFYSPKILDVNNEELCDCLLQIQNNFILIEIKERDFEKRVTYNEEIWLKNKIKKAKEQIKKKFKIFNSYLKHNNENIRIDEQKPINLYFVIVFNNDKIVKYDKNIYSRSIDKNINIFSSTDFNDMLCVLGLPIDIAHYLDYRSSEEFTKNNDLNFRILLGTDRILCLPDKIENEKESAEFFLLKIYGTKAEFYLEQISYYFRIVNFIMDSIGDSPDKKIYEKILTAVDYKLMVAINEKWKATLNDSKLNRLKQPQMLEYENVKIFLFAKPIHVDTEAFIKEIAQNMSPYNKFVYLILLFVFDRENFCIYHFDKTTILKLLN